LEGAVQENSSVWNSGGALGLKGKENSRLNLLGTLDVNSLGGTGRPGDITHLEDGRQKTQASLGKKVDVKKEIVSCCPYRGRLGGTKAGTVIKG